MNGPPPSDIPDQPFPTGTTRFTFPEDPEDPPIEDPAPRRIVPGGAGEIVMGQLPHELYEARVPIVIALRMQGYSRNRIAQVMKLSRASVDWCIRDGRKRGELVQGMLEANTIIEEEAVPLAAETLVHHLRKHDKESAFKTLEGKGLLVRHTANDGAGGPASAPLAFQFNFITKDGQTLPSTPELPALDGAVIGTERVE